MLQIQWYLDGKLLTNSFTTNITHTYSIDAPKGHYHFKSTLISELSWTSRPECNVKAKGISPVISYACSSKITI